MEEIWFIQAGRRKRHYFFDLSGHVASSYGVHCMHDFLFAHWMARQGTPRYSLAPLARVVVIAVLVFVSVKEVAELGRACARPTHPYWAARLAGDQLTWSFFTSSSKRPCMQPSHVRPHLHSPPPPSTRAIRSWPPRSIRSPKRACDCCVVVYVDRS
jgi:hypothetical protein